MLRQDFLIHNEVRRELVRTQAFVEKIKSGTTRGVVYLGGEFRIRLVGAKLAREKYHDVLISTLIALEKRLRRISGVVDIVFQFSNIQKFGGFWRPVLSRTKTAGPVYILPTEDLEITEEEPVQEEGEGSP
jgi:hypothetical protein